MKAVILIGGEGTRLRPLTCNTPKAIVPVLNRPFMEHLIYYLKKHGITDIILAMSYLPDPIQDCLSDGSHLGASISYVTEDSPLGTAGAVKNAESFIDGPFIVLNGDILTKIDLTAMIKRHQKIKPRVSIALTPVDNPTIYGVVETHIEGMVRRFVEKPSWDKVTTNMINAGIYILEPEILAQIPASRRSMFEHDIFPLLLDKGEPILGYSSDAYWIDIGTPEKYLKVHHDLLLNQANDYIETEGKSQIHRSAKIEGPVLIGKECIVAKDVKIKGPTVLGPKCRIDNSTIVGGSVLWDGVNIGERSVIKNSVVGTGCNIQGRRLILEGCVLGDNVQVESGLAIVNATRVKPDTYLS